MPSPTSTATRTPRRLLRLHRPGRPRPVAHRHGPAVPRTVRRTWHRTHHKGRRLAAAPFPRTHGGQFEFYGNYYNAQAMFQIGGRHWQEYANWMYATYLPEQAADGAMGQQRGRPHLRHLDDGPRLHRPVAATPDLSARRNRRRGNQPVTLTRGTLCRTRIPLRGSRPPHPSMNVPHVGASRPAALPASRLPTRRFRYGCQNRSRRNPRGGVTGRIARRYCQVGWSLTIS